MLCMNGVGTLDGGFGEGGGGEVVSSWESNEVYREEMSCLWGEVVGAVMHWNCCLDCAYFLVFDHHDRVFAPI
jgi:hypothetical protein